MERSLDQDISRIQDQLIEMGRKVQHMLEESTRALIERNSTVAKEIIELDKQIDEMEIQVDESICQAIALRQPIAKDLRALIADMKINGELERMADYCEGICRQVVRINAFNKVPEIKEFEPMAGLVAGMVGDCISAYVSRDVDKAKRTILEDDKVDELARKIIDILHNKMKENPDYILPCSALLLITAKLERIADQATNISEEIVFIVTGNDIRHKGHNF